VPFERKNKRLPSLAYRGKGIYFITVCTQGRRSVFVNSPVSEFVLRCLASAASEQGYLIHAYCLMPDHLHFLAEARESVCELSRFLSLFKQKTGFAYQKTTKRRLWQPRYYDHALRKPGDVEPVAWYIWTNPIRKGLCSAPQDYPYSGSFTIDWKNRCAPTDLWSPPWKTSSA
jgi:REP element-mobilizing transposase RayT